ncbi:MULTISPECIES: hypothetical protein [Bacteroidales]|uniref:hypothetical protein n=1 Tax=Bacteroidales TaxID=171549 RepID=UPI00266DCF1D|nr:MULTISPECIES: hypothetical protein [Bacteroidales]
MIGQFNIDGIDAYERFGIFIADTGLVGLLQYPALKKVDSNDWPEEDGEEFDLSTPALETKTLQIKFASHKANRVGAFIEKISDKSYHDFEVPAIKQTFRLRLTDQQSLVLYLRGKTFTLQFADDFPLRGYTYLAPQSTMNRVCGYEIDGVDLGQYGVSILEGSLAEIEKSPAVKQNLLQNFQREYGAIYDGELVVFKAKDVKLKCAMRATSEDEFWRNYKALLFDLTRAEERQLYVDKTGYEYPCYYKSCASSKFLPMRGRIWWVFDLTLVFTSFRVIDDEYLLASEDGELVISEDGEFTIDLGEYGY